MNALSLTQDSLNTVPPTIASHPNRIWKPKPTNKILFTPHTLHVIIALAGARLLVTLPSPFKDLALKVLIDERNVTQL